MFMRREQQELALIRTGMKLDTEKKVIMVMYPYIKDPSILPENRAQVIVMVKGQEKRLRKLG